MLTYNLWRWLQMVQPAQRQEAGKTAEFLDSPAVVPEVNHTMRIARPETLYLPAKINRSGGATVVKYSVHDAGSAQLLDFMKYLALQEIGLGGINWR